jgi:3-oxoacyl-[acyl-carrier-protein] synthase II
MLCVLDQKRLELLTKSGTGELWFSISCAPAGIAITQITETSCSGVCIGTGIAGVAQIADAGRLVLEGRGHRVTPFFIPSVLNNMAAGAFLLRYLLQ